MAATEKPARKKAQVGYKGTTVVEQPPTKIWVVSGGTLKPTDISHLLGDEDAFYEAISKRDMQVWDYDRIAAECDRDVAKVRVWGSNYYRVAAGKPPLRGERVLIKPDGIKGRPWWYAWRIRDWMIREGLQDRQGVRQPYTGGPGRQEGAKDRRPRQVKPSAMRQGAPQVLEQYRQLLESGERDGNARALLGSALGVSQEALNRRLKEGRKAAIAAGALVERDAAWVKDRYAELAMVKSDDEAREMLVRLTLLSRRQIAALLKA